MNFKEVISQPEYDFLRDNKDISNLMLLTVGGSHAYGLNTKDSDIDLRGISYNTKEKILGLDAFEQHVDVATDTTIYSLSKIIPLLMACNPNTIEMFGSLPEHYIVMSKHGQMLKDNIDLFLSQIASKSFSGYAISQLHRLQNAVCRDALSEAQKEEYVRQTLENNIIHFKTTYTDFDYGGIVFTMSEDDELLMTINLKDYPVRDFIGIYSEMNNIVKDFDKIRHRNNKKDEYHLNKHSSHIIRLLFTGIDLLEGKGIITYRGNCPEFGKIQTIKAGEYMLSDGTYDSAFFDFVEEVRKRFEYAKKHTCLPEKPDRKKIQELTMEINKSIILAA